MYEDSPFEELAVGCENCHGPGQLHVEERYKALPLGRDSDTAIFNPAKLSHWLADNVCMACQEGGDVRIPQPGKSVMDFRPGTPLDRTIAVLAIPPEPCSGRGSPLLKHYSLMILSKCYLRSAGKLSCITCHDPHQQLAGTDAVDHYRQKCLGCHTEHSCSLPLDIRMKKVPANDCTRCRMSKQELQVITHSALTNHRIGARSDEPLAETAFHQTTPALPDLIHLTANEEERAKPISPLVLPQAYAQLVLQHSRVPEILRKSSGRVRENRIVRSFRSLRARAAKDPPKHAVMTKACDRIPFEGNPKRLHGSYRLRDASQPSGSRRQAGGSPRYVETRHRVESVLHPPL